MDDIPFDRLLEMARNMPKPSPWATGPILVIGLPGNVHLFMHELQEAFPPSKSETMTRLPTGPQFVAAPTTVADPDFILLVAGREMAKVYLTSFDEFMKRWKRDGDALAAIIKRLQSY